MQYNITSKQNPRIVEINKLKIKKFRNNAGLGIIEGVRIINDAIKQGILFKTIVVIDAFKDDYSKIITKANCKDVLIVPQNVFSAISNTENSQGLLGIVEIKNNAFALPQNAFLVLDNIQDPGNLGTIIRTAVALNYKEIYLYNCADYTSDKVLRATMGTVFKASVMLINEEQLNVLADRRTLLLADASGKPLNNFKLNQPNFGIILCNEGNGPSDGVKKLKSEKLSIKMQNDVESLNVASAGAILMYVLSVKE